MRMELMDILVCPIPTCRGDLKLKATEWNGDEIVEGSLRCQAQTCGESYPIEDTIPNMLPPDMRGDGD